MNNKKRYSVNVELTAPDAYNVQRVTAAVALALAEEPAHDLKVTRIDLEEQEEIDLEEFNATSIVEKSRAAI